MYKLLVLGLVFSAIAAQSQDFCASINHAVSASSEEGSATAFCSSHLSTFDDTITTTKTLTKRNGAAANTVTTRKTVTDTVTIYASIFTVTTPLTGCSSPTSLTSDTSTAQRKRDVGHTPAVMSSLFDDEISDACDCLGITPKTSTVTSLEHTTVSDKLELARDVAAKTTTLTKTRHTTTTISSVTPTVTVTGGINLLSSATKQWAQVEGLTPGYRSHGQLVHFNRTEQSEGSMFKLSTGNELLYGHSTALGLSDPSGEYVLFQKSPPNSQGLSCTISHDSHGCALGCLSLSASGSSGNYVEYRAPHWWYIGVSGRASGAEFTVYAVGASAGMTE